MGSEYLRDQLYSGDWSPLSHRGIAEFILQSYGYTAYARYKGKPPSKIRTDISRNGQIHRFGAGKSISERRTPV